MVAIPVVVDWFTICKFDPEDVLKHSSGGRGRLFIHVSLDLLVSNSQVYID